MATNEELNSLIDSFQEVIDKIYESLNNESHSELYLRFLRNDGEIYKASMDVLRHWLWDGEHNKLEKKLGRKITQIFNETEIALCLRSAFVFVADFQSPAHILQIFKAVKEFLS